MFCPCFPCLDFLSRCIDKIETVEEIEYDEVEQCDHSYDKKCHTTYVTEYESQQEEECEDNFKKSCDITYSPTAQNVTVEVCMRPLVKVRCLPLLSTPQHQASQFSHFENMYAVCEGRVMKLLCESAVL